MMCYSFYILLDYFAKLLLSVFSSVFMSNVGLFFLVISCNMMVWCGFGIKVMPGLIESVGKCSEEFLKCVIEFTMKSSGPVCFLYGKGFNCKFSLMEIGLPMISVSYGVSFGSSCLLRTLSILSKLKKSGIVVHIIPLMSVRYVVMSPLVLYTSNFYLCYVCRWV